MEDNGAYAVAARPQIELIYRTGETPPGQKKKNIDSLGPSGKINFDGWKSNMLDYVMFLQLILSLPKHIIFPS